MIAAGEVAELLSALIRNECVNDGTPDSGFEERSVATVQDYLGEDGRVFEPRPGRQSVLYRLPGRDPQAPSLMLMGHLDVVPANPERWSRDPFGGERVGGEVWGRGAVDMLNLTAAMAAVFRRYLRGELPRPAGDLLYLAVADEEAAGTWGASWLVDNHPDEVACDYLLTELAYPAIPATTGMVYPVTVLEKGPAWRKLYVGGTPGHGSQPFRTDNAVVHLAAAVRALVESPGPVRIIEEWRHFVDGTGWDDQLTDPARLDGAIDRLAERDLALGRYAHACTHLTVSPNVVTGGVKINVIPDHASVQLDVRALPGQDEDEIDRYLLDVIGDDLAGRIRLERVLTQAASGSPAAGPLWEAIGDALESMTGSRAIVPAVVAASTDARFFRPIGTVAYGVGLYDPDTRLGDFLSMFHGDDERVSEASLGLTATLLSRIVERLLG